MPGNFILLLILYLTILIGVAIFFVILTNRRNKEKISTLRDDWTNKLHQDLGGDISSIKLRLYILEKKLKTVPPEVSKDLTKARQVLDGVQKKSRYILDLIDNRQNSLTVILADVIEFAESNLVDNGTKFHFENNLPEQLEHSIDIIRINKLYLAIKEVVNNCMKYAKAENAYLSISPIARGICIKMQDDGIGFDTKKTSTGSGLKNLKQYSEDGAIHISIQSSIGGGTETTMTVLY